MKCNKKTIWTGVWIVFAMALCGVVGGCVAQPGGSSSPWIDGPTPTEPESWMTVTIDSIPSGATVYLINSDNTIGRRLGTTPTGFKIGFAGIYSINTKTGERTPYATSMVAWGGDNVEWRLDTEKLSYNLDLKVALAKNGYETVAGIKTLYSSPWQVFKDRRFPAPQAKDSVAFTVPLKSTSQAYADRQIAIQQQQRQQVSQQNITIQQQKDAWDEANSGLDVIIKLGAIKSMINP